MQEKLRIFTAEVVRLVVEHPLDSNDIRGIGTVGADSSHDRNKNMLLDREWAGVEVNTKDLPVGKKSGPGTTDREGQQLGDNLQSAVRIFGQPANESGRRTPPTWTEGYRKKKN